MVKNWRAYINSGVEFTHNLLDFGLDSVQNHRPCNLSVAHDRFYVDDHLRTLREGVPDSITRWSFDLDQQIPLEFTKNGRRLVTNSSDRTLRQFNVPVYAAPSANGEFVEQELEPTHRFNDPINKTAWHAMSYSSDGEWLAGGKSWPSNFVVALFSYTCNEHRCSRSRYP